MIKVSFIIPCRNSEKTIGATLDAIASCDIPSEQKEIIVVDNGSRDRTIALASLPGVTIVRCEKRGAGAARNYGARHARGMYLAFIDSDTVIEKDWASILISHLESMPYSAALGKVLPSGEDNFLTGYRKKLAGRRYQGTNISLYHFTGMSPVINTAACIFRKTVFEAIGGFDERLRRYEDTEISYRLFSYGGVIFGSHHARARVYNTGTPWDYLKRSFELGLSKRSLGSVNRFSEVFSMRSALEEFNPRGLQIFSALEKTFFYLNGLFMIAGYLRSYLKGVPSPVKQLSGLRVKLMSIFNLDGHVLCDEARLIVVDDEFHFFLTRFSWKKYVHPNLPWNELHKAGLIRKI